MHWMEYFLFRHFVKLGPFYLPLNIPEIGFLIRQSEVEKAAVLSVTK